MSFLSCLTKVSSLAFRSGIVSMKPVLAAPLTTSLLRSFTSLTNWSQGFLQPNALQIVPSCGMKYKARIRKRCKDCYFVWKDHRVYNYCKTHPRHKSCTRRLTDKYFFIITHETANTPRKW